MRNFMRVLLAITVMGAIALSLVGGVAAGYQLYYQDRIYPGVHFAASDLSGLTKLEAAEAIRQQFQYNQQNAITLRYGDRTWQMTPLDLGLVFDLDGTVNRAYAYGRSESMLVDLQKQWNAWYADFQLPPTVVYYEQQAQYTLAKIANDINKPVRDATLSVEGLQVQLTDSEPGRTMDVQATTAQLLPVLQNFGTAELPLVVTEYSPAVLDAEFQAQVARNIISEPLVLGIAESRPNDPAPWTIDQPTLASWLTIERMPAADGTATYQVNLRESEMRKFLGAIADSLAIAPQNPRLDFNQTANTFTVLQAGVQGRKLNIDNSIQVINEQLIAGSHAIPLQFDVIAPAVADTAIPSDLGVLSLVSAQTSSFAGSNQSRIANVQAGANSVSGFLVPPHGTFSFNEAVGDISLDKGFAEALIIYGGRTIKGVGGGICQVSTTVYRTAVYGGYPIVERYPHAYRVGYYEQGAGSPGPGLDATIFSPVVDFRFKNDRDAWLLVESEVNVPGRQITFRFYSTDDGRVTSVSKPVVSNSKTPPKPLYVENANLPTGEIRQVDYEAVGADVDIKRMVTAADGATLIDETIVTKYEPWQAVFEYGPGTKLPADANKN